MADRGQPDRETLERRTIAIGRELLERARAATPGALRAGWWEDQILQWAMGDERLRAQLFRFVDVLPCLQSGRDVAAHLREYLLLPGLDLPPPLAQALRFSTPDSLSGRLAALAARQNVRRLGRRFIAGETLDEAIACVEKLRRRGMSFTLDRLGEAVTSEVQADEYAAGYLELIDALCGAAQRWPPGPGGSEPRVNVSLKLTALDPRFDAIAPDRCAATVLRRLRPILRAARVRNAFVNIDMEEYRHKRLALDIFKTVAMEEEFRHWRHLGIVLQAYLRDCERDLRELLAWVRRRGCPIAIRLVKGAYWEHEIALASQRGWPLPVFTEKWQTDGAFEGLLALLMEHADIVRPAVASHNVRSLARALALAELQGLKAEDFEIQMLFGMGDPLKDAIVERGSFLRVYAPYGPLIPGMGYLIRRLLENTSNNSFLRQSFHDDVPLQTLLACPRPPRPVRRRHPGGGKRKEGRMSFANEPVSDFAIAGVREAMARALRRSAQWIGARPFGPVIEGEEIAGRELLQSLDPSHKDRIIGRVGCATAEDAARAVEAARAAWPRWRATAAGERAAVLRRAAALMRQQRFDLAACIVREVGKPWRDADADVAEAIDFCEYYAFRVQEMAGRPWRRDLPGEENVMLHEPRGVAAVIAPWNFPLAILTGMAAAALVTGNTVVMKPAEQSSVVAAKLFRLLLEAGVPAAALSYLPGIGEEVGPVLAEHPEVDLIAFTGSRAVGLEIIERASRRSDRQRTAKKVIAEMGGKNAIIVDADADLDAAVTGVVESAFGYAGQKCSACSRVVVLSQVHDLFLERLRQTTLSLRVGPADDPSTDVGPLIDEEARRRVLSFIEQGETEADLALQMAVDDEDGFYVGPAIFDRVPPQAVIAREEIFGPVLAVLVASDFDSAIEIANATDYALTGGLYSRSPAHIEQARRELQVGNLYVNRRITGAVVDRQPFGGFKLSGAGSKAGGPDYLLQFCNPKVISENTMRHGFAPSTPPESTSEQGSLEAQQNDTGPS